MQADQLAHAAVMKAKREGSLIAEPCEVCKAEETQAHHDDYAAPLTVRWLCRVCHSAWHRKHGPGANAGKRQRRLTLRLSERDGQNIETIREHTGLCSDSEIARVALTRFATVIRDDR